MTTDIISTTTTPGLRAPETWSAPEGNGGASFLGASGQVATRTVRKFIRSPQLIVAGTAQGALFLLIFRYVFGGAIGHLGTLSYVDFLVPGFVVTSVLFSGMGSATGIAEDLQSGLFDRLRSLPIRLLSIVTGRVAADTSLLTYSLSITAAIGFLVGFRTHNGAGAAAMAFGLCVLYGFSLCWLFIGLGLVAGSPQAAQGISFLVFPLSFVSTRTSRSAPCPAGCRRSPAINR